MSITQQQHQYSASRDDGPKRTERNRANIKLQTSRFGAGFVRSLWESNWRCLQNKYSCNGQLAERKMVGPHMVDVEPNKQIFICYYWFEIVYFSSSSSSSSCCCLSLSLRDTNYLPKHFEQIKTQTSCPKAMPAFISLSFDSDRPPIDCLILIAWNDSRARIHEWLCMPSASIDNRCHSRPFSAVYFFPLFASVCKKEKKNGNSRRLLFSIASLLGTIDGSCIIWHHCATDSNRCLEETCARQSSNQVIFGIDYNTVL